MSLHTFNKPYYSTPTYIIIVGIKPLNFMRQKPKHSVIVWWYKSKYWCKVIISVCTNTIEFHFFFMSYFFYSHFFALQNFKKYFFAVSWFSIIGFLTGNPTNWLLTDCKEKITHKHERANTKTLSSSLQNLLVNVKGQSIAGFHTLNRSL